MGWTPRSTWISSATLRMGDGRDLTGGASWKASTDALGRGAVARRPHARNKTKRSLMDAPMQDRLCFEDMAHACRPLPHFVRQTRGRRGLHRGERGQKCWLATPGGAQAAYACRATNLYLPLPWPETGSMKRCSFSLLRRFPADDDPMPNMRITSERPKTPTKP